MKYYGVVLGIVTELVVTIVGSIYLGSYLDKQYHKENLFIAVLTILGLIFGMYRLIVRLKVIMDKPDA